MELLPDTECPNCTQQFQREENSQPRGYNLLGKGETISLIRCTQCGIELPVPESASASVVVSTGDSELSARGEYQLTNYRSEQE